MSLWFLKMVFRRSPAGGDGKLSAERERVLAAFSAYLEATGGRYPSPELFSAFAPRTAPAKRKMSLNGKVAKRAAGPRRRDEAFCLARQAMAEAFARYATVARSVKRA